jgi:hypothetical protein
MQFKILHYSRMSSSTEPGFDFRKMFKWFDKGEVKTPLAFFFKVLPWLTGVWGLILYAPIPVDMKMHLVELSSGVFGAMFVFVGVFAWVNPRHLLYGEAGHRAERRMEFGTERRTYTAEELKGIPPSRNPQQLSGEQSEKL